MFSLPQEVWQSSCLTKLYSSLFCTCFSARHPMPRPGWEWGLLYSSIRILGHFREVYITLNSVYAYYLPSYHKSCSRIFSTIEYFGISQLNAEDKKSEQKYTFALYSFVIKKLSFLGCRRWNCKFDLIWVDIKNRDFPPFF